MKDIYELLNQVEVEESEIPEAEISELEKKRIKKNLRNKINTKEIHKGLIAVAITFLIISGVGVIGAVNPAIAKDIPFIGDIFKVMKDCYYRGAMVEAFDGYKDYSDDINLVQESNGVKITIRDCVFDGKTIFFTYELETDKNLGNNIYAGSYFKLGEIDYKLPCEGQQMQVVSKGMYIGQGKINLEHESDEVKFNLRFKDIKDIDAEKEIKGDWNFDISLNAIESIEEKIDKSIENQGIKLNIESIDKTPISIKINYTQAASDELLDKWNRINPVLSIRDDVGNYYRCEENSYHYAKAQNNVSYCDMVGKIDDNATKLIITPVIELSNEDVFDENGWPIGKKEVSSENEFKTDTIVFKNDIIIDLK